MTHRRLVSSPAPAELPDELLWEILLRLRPLPSSLLRASLVCHRWRRLSTDATFLHRFRAYHRKPPLLGFFATFPGSCTFVPALDPPDRISSARLSQLPRQLGDNYSLCGCRHGLALIICWMWKQAVVWNPVTGGYCRVPLPPAILTNSIGMNATVLGNERCQLSPFKLVMVWNNWEHGNLLAYIYRSESAIWEIVSNSTTLTPLNHLIGHSVLVGNTLCWQIDTGCIFQIDLDTKSLAVINKPIGAWFTAADSVCIVRTCDNGLGLAVLSGMIIQLWETKTDLSSDAIVGWVLQKTIELDKLLPREPSLKRYRTKILGFVDDVDAILLSWNAAVVNIQLDSLQFRKFSGNCRGFAYHPYASFFTEDKSSSLRCKNGV